MLRGEAVRSGAVFLLLWLVKMTMPPILGRILPGLGLLLRGWGVISGAGFLVLWLVKVTMPPILG